MINSIYRKLTLIVMQSEFYEFIITKIIPFIRISFYYSKMRGFKYKKAYSLLQPGDYILCKDEWKLTTWLIPGKYSHAALCVDKTEDSLFEVAEMTHLGFTKSTFYDIFRESTSLVILRCKDWDKEYTEKVIEKCRSFEGTPYDVIFQFGIKTLYCSELVYEADFEKRLQISTEDLMGLGRKYISPYGLSKAKNVDIIYDSDVL